MYNYVNDVSTISHTIISSGVKNCVTAIDATLGNGYDTDFLSRNFTKVFSFDIQENAIEKYRIRRSANVELINDSHENFKEYVHTDVDCIVYNLGFLPGGDKNITTNWQSTLKSIKIGLEMLRPGGIMCVAIYAGHEEGKKEKEVILDYVSKLDKKKYGVLTHCFLNRSNEPPILIAIEKGDNR